MEDNNAEKIFSIFDNIKPHLNEILIKGIESISRENYEEIVHLKENLEYMHLNTINKKLTSFIAKIDLLLQGKATKDLKQDLAVSTLHIITIIRMFERIMTLEIVKKDLQKNKE